MECVHIAFQCPICHKRAERYIFPGAQKIQCSECKGFSPFRALQILDYRKADVDEAKIGGFVLEI